MSYDNPRIQLSDTIQDILFKMSDGNPGALNVLISLYRDGGAIDPDSAFEGLAPILDLDTLNIYGSHIWVLYKDVCGQKLDRLVALLRANQLGFIDGAIITAAAQDPRAETKIDVEGLLAQVKERLPAFNATP